MEATVSRAFAAPSWASRIAQPGAGPGLAEGARAQAGVSHALVMLQLSSLITSEGQGPVRFIMGLWCLLIPDSTAFDRQPKIKANKGLWEGGLNNCVGWRTKKKVSK